MNAVLAIRRKGERQTNRERCFEEAASTITVSDILGVIMGKTYDHIPDRLCAFIARSKLFYVATAPLDGGSVNVSPKGNEGTFEVVDQNRVRYLDLTGSGNETISHLFQPGNGRITLMFANIEQGAPNIVRLYGKGTVYERGADQAFDQSWHDKHGTSVPVGGRAIIDVAVHTCSTSCGYSLPIYEFKRKRTVLDDFFAKFETMGDKGGEALAKYKGSNLPRGPLTIIEGGKRTAGRPVHSALEVYWSICNNLSIDGLPGLQCVSSMIKADEQRRLLEKAKEHDRLEAPTSSLGPLQSANDEPKRASGLLVMPPKLDLPQIGLGFTAGCALSLAVLLAMRMTS